MSKGFYSKSALETLHQIYQDINNGIDTCLVFLNVSKAFDMVWHKGLLFKLRQLGIVSTLYEWIASYLIGRSQKVVIKGISFSLRYRQNWNSKRFNFSTITIFNLYE